MKPKIITLIIAAVYPLIGYSQAQFTPDGLLVGTLTKSGNLSVQIKATQGMLMQKYISDAYGNMDLKHFPFISLLPTTVILRLSTWHPLHV